MSHHHEHNHHHEDDPAPGLTLEEKLAKLFNHWVAHNESHSQTYREWGKKAAAEGMTEVAALLNNIADLNDRITENLHKGMRLTAAD